MFIEPISIAEFDQMCLASMDVLLKWKYTDDADGLALELQCFSHPSNHFVLFPTREQCTLYNCRDRDNEMDMRF